MNTTPVKSINVTSINLVEGEYEGYKYYKLVAETSQGFKLSTKLTAFEYKTLKAVEDRRQ